MDKKQYNNIINWTLKHEKTLKIEDNISIARAIFNNMGVALPQGNCQEIANILESDDYMGWKSCTAEEAQEAVNRGTAAIAVSGNKFIIIAAEDEEEPVVDTTSVMTLSKTANANSTMKYYAYDNNTTTNSNDNGREAIIIIPGIMGSELFAGEANGSKISRGTKLWDPDANLYADDKIRMLACDDEGDSVYNVYASNQNYGAKSTYKRIYNRLAAEFSSTYDVLYFPYDWRKPCMASAVSLNEFIDKSNYSRVILVAHSMGGLVAACYLSLGLEQRSKVHKLIALGAPFLGATELIRVYNEGMDLGFLSGLIVNDDIKDIMPNIRSVYELLPTKKWFELTNEKIYTYKKLYTVEGYDDDGKTFTSQTYYDTKNQLYKKLKQFDSSLLTLAENMHAGMFINGDHVTNLVDSYYIVGKNLSTVNSISANVIGETGEMESIDYNKNNKGDGTVAVWSADIGGMYPNKTYYASGRDHCGEYDFDENVVKTEGLVVSANVIQLIKNIINDSSALPSGITRTR